MPRKGFYIDDILVLKKLANVDNQSKYVEQLILNDILKNGLDGNVVNNNVDLLNLLLKQVELLRIQVGE